MGTMLMTKSTPRITYRIGIRAGLGALDESLPWRNSESAVDRSGGGFTCIYRSLLWKEWLEAENRRHRVTKVSAETGVWQGFGRGNARKPTVPYVLRVSLLPRRAHQVRNRFREDFCLMQDGVQFVR